MLFRNDSSGAVSTMNSWVAEKTDNKITNIIEQSVINDHARLIIVNAVYFKADWLKKFDIEVTSVDNFYVSSRESVPVKMMFMRKVELNYGVNDELRCHAVELPYVGNTASMFIILPVDTKTNLAEVEKKLTPDDLINVDDKFGMAPIEGQLWLPRFRLDETLSLEEALAGMGMTDLFKEGDADLSGVDGTNRLYVSKAVHRAVCDVTEEGTEAAAIAGWSLGCDLRKDYNSFRFRADRPFVFLIQDKPTRSILFLGRLVKPPAVPSAGTSYFSCSQGRREGGTRGTCPPEIPMLKKI